ncbi:MAG: hypothetical protein PVG30_06560 [Gammaproteobacteria bacterium]|jgi:hypothetical protein
MYSKSGKGETKLYLVQLQQKFLRAKKNINGTIKKLECGFFSRTADERKKISELLEQNYNLLAKCNKSLDKISYDLKKINCCSSA